MTDAQLRTVGITLHSHPLGRYSYIAPLIYIDGVMQLAEWRLRGQWQLPADSAVTIAVAQKVAGSGQLHGLAEIVLPAGGDIELEYRAPGFWSAQGTLIPGAVQPRV